MIKKKEEEEKKKMFRIANFLLVQLAITINLHLSARNRKKKKEINDANRRKVLSILINH